MRNITLTPPEALRRAAAAFGAGKHIEAERLCRAILAVKHDYLLALHLLAVVQARQGRWGQAVASYEQVLTVQPDHAEAFNNCGNNLRKLKRLGDALASYERALALQPNNVEVHCSRGNTLSELKRFNEALSSYERALALQPDHDGALNNCGNVLRALHRFDESLASYARALAASPDSADALNNRAVTLQELGRFDPALASCDQALALRPAHIDTLNNRAALLRQLRRFGEALESYDRVIVLQADDKRALSGRADCAVKLCDWILRDKLAGAVCRNAIEGNSIISPFLLLGYTDDASLHLSCARDRVRERIGKSPEPLCCGTWRNEKIRIAYISGDFRRHPSAYLMAELFELHDRSRFEVIGLSFGHDDHSKIRARLVAGFDQFIDVAFKSDEEVARLIHDLRVDIAVDLMGHTTAARPRIMAFRAAPIQGSYLGFPCTMGADFVDYIIADEIVLPLDQQCFYTEKIVHLPDCFQANDRKGRIAGYVTKREEIGLPGDGFVFCCLNNSWKISSVVFDVWMRLLGNIEGSVLWLLSDNEQVERNLLREAQARGIEAHRLVFTRRVQYAEYLARYRLADLFLDTLPYNSGATASDALWSGLPLLTCQGSTFAGRMASSLLHAIGLSDLVTRNLADYEAMASNLVRNRTLLAEIKQRLARNRDTHPLFDTERFCRNIEAAYTQMWDIWQRGEGPRQIILQKDLGRDSY